MEIVNWGYGVLVKTGSGTYLVPEMTWEWLMSEEGQKDIKEAYKNAETGGINAETGLPAK